MNEKKSPPIQSEEQEDREFPFYEETTSAIDERLSELQQVVMNFTEHFAMLDERLAQLELDALASNKEPND